jgi:hypothetical protein
MIGPFNQKSSFGPSLDWQRRPALGDAGRRDHLRRIRALRQVAMILCSFAAGVAFAAGWFH